MSCVLCTMSMMELETRKMLSAHTKISNGFHSGAHDTAGLLLAHNNNSSSINTAITWFQPEGVPRPPLSHSHIQIERRTFSESHARPRREIQVLPHSCRRRDDCCTSFQKHIPQAISSKTLCTIPIPGEFDRPMSVSSGSGADVDMRVSSKRGIVEVEAEPSWVSALMERMDQRLDANERRIALRMDERLDTNERRIEQVLGLHQVRGWTNMMRSYLL